MLILSAINLSYDLTDPKCMYAVTVHINTREIWRGTVGPHDRTLGWEALVKQIAEAALGGAGKVTNEVRRECPTCKTTKVVRNEPETKGN